MTVKSLTGSGRMKRSSVVRCRMNKLVSVLVLLILAMVVVSLPVFLIAMQVGAKIPRGLFYTMLTIQTIVAMYGVVCFTDMLLGGKKWG